MGPKTLEAIGLLTKFKNQNFGIKAFRDSYSTYSNQNTKAPKVGERES